MDEQKWKSNCWLKGGGGDKKGRVKVIEQEKRKGGDAGEKGKD